METNNIKTTINLIVSIDIETTKSIDDVKKALTRGIYKGLDTEPNYIAAPKDVKINYLETNNNKNINQIWNLPCFEYNFEIYTKNPETKETGWDIKFINVYAETYFEAEQKLNTLVPDFDCIILFNYKHELNQIDAYNYYTNQIHFNYGF